MDETAAVRSAGRFAGGGVASVLAAGVVWTVVGAGSGWLVMALLVVGVVSLGVAANRVASTSEAEDGDGVDDEASAAQRRQTARKMGGGNA
jgi:hypothetical protein